MPQDQTRAERRAQFKRGFARDLRNNATEGERKLWAYLRRKRVGDVRFRRQQAIGPYIVDFFCSAAKLIVELDGSQHGTDSAIAYDAARTEWLETRGYRVLRVANAEFQADPDACANAIWRAVESSRTPLPEISPR